MDNDSCCLICYEDLPTSDLDQQGCGHGYCKDCWTSYIESKINDISNSNKLLQIFCPSPDCSHFIRKEFILSHLSFECLEKYKEILNKIEIKEKKSLLSCFKYYNSNDNNYSYYFCKDIDYYHYECLCECDTGWGCSYRCIQIILSCINYTKDSKISIPSIYDIQCTLANIGKNECFRKEQICTPAWIGPYEIIEYVNIILPDNDFYISDEYLFEDLSINTLHEKICLYFKSTPNPIPLILTNGKKTYSVGGIRIKNDNNSDILLIDPHFSENCCFGEYEKYYSSKEISSNEEQEDIKKRKNEMIKNSLSWENTITFLSTSQVWCILWSK